MAATVVHEGLEGGNLFAGIKFHLLQRIPFRNTWKDLILANGGEIVQIEKLADIVIADHVRKDCPPGSISWTYIDQSVKKGSLRDIEDHRAGPVKHIVREVSSGQPTRRGKVFFTEEDDRILMQWCARAERKGISLGGNELYKQLEAKNNRHTYQSWRDRWIKYVSLRPRPDPSKEDEVSGSEGNVPHPIYSSSQARPPINKRLVSQQAPELAPKTVPGSMKRSSKPIIRSSREEAANSNRNTRHKLVSQSQSQSPVHPYRIKSLGGNVFTDEETQLLEAEYDAIMNLNEDQVIDAWIAWAAAHPNHTPQEWRNYFKEYVAPKMQAEATRKRSGSSSPHLIRRSPEVHASRPNTSKPPSSRVTEIKGSRDSFGQNLSSPEAKEKPVDPTMIDEELFKADLIALADYLGLDVEFNPVICGKPISLFRLWQVVRSPDFGGFDAVNGRKSWPKVANKLNFNIFRNPSAADDLKRCYSEILADFENARAEYEGEPIRDSQEKDMIENQPNELLGHESLEDFEGDDRSEEMGEEEDHDDDLDYSRSSPVQPIPSSSSKRSFGADRSNESTTHSKRQRIKGKRKELEIPSTPEDIVKNPQTFRLSHKRSPLRFSSSQRPDVDLLRSEEIPTRPVNFDSSKPSRDPVAEPETQDFHFQPELDESEEQEDNSSFVERSSPPIIRGIYPEHGTGAKSTGKYALHSVNTHDDSSTQSQSDCQRDAIIEAYFKQKIESGYPAEIVVDALEHTTLEYGSVAEIVMERLLNGDGIPEDTPGAWTTWDDEALVEPTDSKEFQRIVKKHGSTRVRNRKRYLRERGEIKQEGG